jgi:NAD(P)-dependent dehydrogenase (short-subunit alcohol dehydrogenase family)
METSMEEMKSWMVENSLGMLCDIRVRETVDAVIKKSIERWGKIDIIAKWVQSRCCSAPFWMKCLRTNNSCTGYGVIGACEDQSEHELRSQFETNVYGTLNMLALSLPYFRSQSTGGRYLIFSSTSGALGTPGLGPFCATKYAVEGLIESMLYEVDAYNIKATLVEPGHMRLDEPDAKQIGLKKYSAFKIKKASVPYTGPHAPAGHARRMVQWLNDRQPVSTVKSAELVWQLAHCKYPPLRLLLGTYAVESIRDRLRCVIEEIEDWKHLSFPVVVEEEEEEEREGGDDNGKDKEGEKDGEEEDEMDQN